MSQIECLPNVGLESADDNDCTPPKKLKQGRLPFKTVDPKSQLISPKSVNISKKRKLSDAESPSAKIAKTPKSGSTNVKDSAREISNETEVSSSSEADHGKVKVRNALERFVRKNSQEEITSSTHSDCIDLTEEEEKESDVSFVDLDTCQSKNIKEFFPVKENCKSKSSEATVANYIKIIEDVSKGLLPSELNEENKENVAKPEEKVTVSDKKKENIAKQDDTVTAAEENKENELNVDVSMESVDSEQNDSALELETSATEPKTPGKTVLQSTSFKTPVSTKSSPQTDSTPTIKSPGDSASDSTPKSGKKPRSKLSEAQRMEREAMRQKAKEEKLKVLEEKKKQKEQERLEKEKEKEKIRLEKEAVKAEKEKQKKEEKEKKEKERLEKLQQKEEELKKKREEQEAKLEEKRKKDEEKRLKEEEKQKENEEKIKKEEKIKNAFQSFFIKPSTSPTSSKPQRETSGLFMPFQVKENTRLAPEHRAVLSEDAINCFDQLASEQKTDCLYLSELKKGKKIRKSSKTYPKESDQDDVELLCHDSEAVKKVTHRCKLLQFHMNYRPPYYGTWSKKSSYINPRNPFKTDTEMLDYEYDSDDDWEEEEPGESLSDCEDEEDKDELDKEEEGDGWMVPHGYLSDDEGVEDDEEVTAEALRIRREAKAEQWESELKRQTKAVLPQIIGCFWEQATHTLQEEISKQLEEYRAVMLMKDPLPTSYNELRKATKGENSSGETGLETPKVNPQRKPVPEEAMPDLIRLVHGNLMGIKKLIREFRIFWKSKTSVDPYSGAANDTSMEVDENDAKTTDTSMSQENINKSINVENENDEAECAISKRQLEIKINAIAVREKRSEFKKICWYVNADVLKQYNCEGLPVPSAWESITQPTKTPAKAKSEEIATPGSGRKTPVPSITQFAKPMSPSSIAAQHAAAQAKIIAAQAEKKKETTEESDKMEITDEVATSNQRKLTDFTKAFSSPQCKKPVPVKHGSSEKPTTPKNPDNEGITVTCEVQNVNLIVKPINKTMELPKVNGVITDTSGENSRDAIVLD